ncbi:hypothetical protein POM88_018154 [Heracleum sosnowskyi]|uniref:Uncharacterized protein n=1 Tax=Heracleum sosnowskyi TaxID=360622 RepID=A0AAD8IQU2_9APIA|nr:hypothetical protein POM88_018154 [Heracleum sosnowskyi]
MLLTRLQLAPAVMKFAWDPVRIQQVWWMFCGSAVQFAEVKGAVVCSLCLRRLGTFFQHCLRARESCSAIAVVLLVRFVFDRWDCWCLYAFAWRCYTSSSEDFCGGLYYARLAGGGGSYEIRGGLAGALEAIYAQVNPDKTQT